MEPDAFERQTLEIREFHITATRFWFATLVTHVVAFLADDEAEAFEAAGLSE